MSGRASFENVVGKVAKEALHEMAQSLEKEYKELLTTMEAEERDASLKAAEMLRSRDRQVETIKRRITSRAELNARNRSIQLLEAAVKEIFEKSLKIFEKQASGKGYEKALERLLEEGVDAIGAKEVMASGNSKDKDVLKKAAQAVSKNRGVKITLSPEPLSCIGGVQVMSLDRSMIYDNTVEARLERLKPILRKKISDMISKEG